MAYLNKPIESLEELTINVNELLECASAGGNAQQAFELHVDTKQLAKIAEDISELMSRVSTEHNRLDNGSRPRL